LRSEKCESLPEKKTLPRTGEYLERTYLPELLLSRGCVVIFATVGCPETKFLQIKHNKLLIPQARQYNTPRIKINEISWKGDFCVDMPYLPTQRGNIMFRKGMQS
jgi:hypothetical protein